MARNDVARNMPRMKPLKGSAGFALLELLIAALITGVVATAGFQFYSKMHELTLSQGDISEMQQLCRSSLGEIHRTLRKAGFKVPPGHPPFQISGDTMAIYFNGTQPVDTVLYFLDEFTTAEYQMVPGLPVGQKLYKLMIKINSAAAFAHTDYVSSINYVVIDAANIALTVTIHAGRKDHSYTLNSGFRKYTLSEIVNMRNL